MFLVYYINCIYLGPEYKFRFKRDIALIADEIDYLIFIKNHLILILFSIYDRHIDISILS